MVPHCVPADGRPGPGRYNPARYADSRVARGAGADRPRRGSPGRRPQGPDGRRGGRSGSGQGRARPRRRRRARPEAAPQGAGRRGRRDPRDQAGRGDPLHQLVDCQAGAAGRGDREAPGADRVDDRGAGLSDQGPPAVRPPDRRAGEEGQGRRPGHRRQPRLRDGCPADHADRRLRVGAEGARRPHPGRPDPAPAVPAEDRLRPDARGVPGPRRRRDRAPRRPGRVDHR